MAKKVKEPKVKRKFKDTVVGGFLTRFTGGAVSEVVSLFPVIGHKLATKVDKLTEEVIQERGESNSKRLGHVLIVIVLGLFIYSTVTGKEFFSKDDFVYILNTVRNVLGM